MVSKHLKKNKKLYVAFVDFSKAFDTIKRDINGMCCYNCASVVTCLTLSEPCIRRYYLVSEVTQEILAILTVCKD